jgi:Domain of unknown function (DUF3854)
MSDDLGSKIAPNHRKMLIDSGITAEQAHARGVVSIDGNNRSLLAALGFVKAVQKMDGLLIPLLGADGEPVGWQFRPDHPRVMGNGKENKYEFPRGQKQVIDFPPGVPERIPDRSKPRVIAEGFKKGDAGALAGLLTVDIAGVWNWIRDGVPLPDFRDCGLKGFDWVVCFDSDITTNEKVWGAARELGEWLKLRGANVRYAVLPGGADKLGLDDWLAAGHTVDQFWELVQDELPPKPTEAGEEAEPDRQEPLPAEPISIEECRAVFTRWLGKDYDLACLDAALAVATCDRLDGDPPWLLIVSGSGNAKTETVGALAGAGAIVTSTIDSPGALLSASSKQETAKDATGGLLRKLGGRGLLVIKDFTSILSMDRNMRGKVLAALREVADGFWERNVGVDGGRSIRWKGRVVLIGAVTTAYDAAHAVITAMGDRFMLLRVDSNLGRKASGRQALRNVSHEIEMRLELAEAAGGAIENAKAELAVIDEETRDLLLDLADLVTLARTAVERDPKGEPATAHMPEAPTRLAKMLAQVVRGALALGMDLDHALGLAARIAGDCVPPLRLQLLGDLAENPWSSASSVGRRLQHPWTTVDRALKELHALRLIDQQDPPIGEKGWRYSLADSTDVKALTCLITRNVSRGNLGECSRESSDASTSAPTRRVLASHISGDTQPTLKLVDPEADRELARAVAHVEFAQWLSDLTEAHKGATVDDIDAAEQLRKERS